MKHLRDNKTRGKHTTVIDPAADLLRTCRKLDNVVAVTNGDITLGVRAKGRSAKAQITDPSHVKLTVVTPGSKQTYIVCTRNGKAETVCKTLREVCDSFSDHSKRR